MKYGYSRAENKFFVPSDEVPAWSKIANTTVTGNITIDETHKVISVDPEVFEAYQFVPIEPEFARHQH